MEAFKLTSEQVIRNLYEVAERQDAKMFASLFTDDGYFQDVATGIQYRGEELSKVVAVYAKSFPDMHRELSDFYVSGDVVVVELFLNGTHLGPLEMPAGVIPPTGKKIHVPCCDVFHVRDGKVVSFHCYNAATITLSQLGVLENLAGAIISPH